MGDPRLTALQTDRSNEAILTVLRRALPDRGLVLELASGDGGRAVFLGATFPRLEWQPSDADVDARAQIAAAVLSCGRRNVHMPLELDVTELPWPLSEAEALLCVDLLHCAHWDACIGLLDGARVLLPDGGPLVIHGPLRVGVGPTPRLDDLDRALREINPDWGVRRLDDVVRAAAKRKLRMEEFSGGDEVGATVVLRRDP